MYNFKCIRSNKSVMLKPTKQIVNEDELRIDVLEELQTINAENRNVTAETIQKIRDFYNYIVEQINEGIVSVKTIDIGANYNTIYSVPITRFIDLTAFNHALEAFVSNNTSFIIGYGFSGTNQVNIQVEIDRISETEIKVVIMVYIQK